jgi:hypothetical protein
VDDGADEDWSLDEDPLVLLEVDPLDDDPL